MGSLKIVKASAGSGKTYKLVYEYVRNVVEEPSRYAVMLAVTFTNKATREMKERILRELNGLSCGKSPFLNDLTADLGFLPEKVRENAGRALSLILHDYSRFSVCTIDKFFQKILRGFVRELGIEGDYTIDFNLDYLLSLAVDRLLDSVHETPVLQEWIGAIVEERLSGGRNFDFRKEMTDHSKIIFNERFDRSFLMKNRDNLVGCFRALAEADGALREKIRTCAGEFLSVTAAAGLGADDFSYKRSGFFGYIDKMARGEMDDYGARVRTALDPGSKWASKGREAAVEAARPQLEPLLAELCALWDDNRKFLYSAQAALKLHRTYVVLADIDRQLDAVCTARNLMLLPRSLRMITALIAGNDAPFIYEKIGSRYEIFMIDEFQDTSALQWENFIPLLRNALSAAEDDRSVVIVVGDVKQSIYRWRNGDWRILSEGVERVFSRQRIGVDTLRINWRSQPEVVRFNNGTLRSVVELVDGRLKETFGAFYDGQLVRAYEGMEQQLPPQKERGGYVEVRQYGKKEPEENLRLMVERIEKLQDRGFRPRDIAVLVRTNREAVEAARYIMARKGKGAARYGYDVISQEGLRLTASPMVTFVLALFALAADPADRIAGALCNRYLRRPLDAPVPDPEREFLNGLRLLPLDKAFERIVLRFGLDAEERQLAYIQALHDVIISYTKKYVSDLSQFLEWWEREGEKLTVNLPDGQNAITVETVHKSKGLEYKAVIVPFLSWNLAPRNAPFWAESDDPRFAFAPRMLVEYSAGLEKGCYAASYREETILTAVENVNLLYVMLTRAEQELYLLLSDERGKGSMEELVAEAIGFDGEPRTFGTPSVLLSGEEGHADGRIVIDRFRLCDDPARIALRLRGERYFEEGETDLRGYGVMMHRLFEQVERAEDIPAVAERMEREGEITPAERTELLERAAEAMEADPVRSWFGGEWEVFRERDILIPAPEGSGKPFEVLRPDRVMVSGDRAVVLDYKFGQREEVRHRRQVGRYMALLREMGYREVKGYLWYLQNGSVDEVLA